MTTSETDVLIVGGGPTGLALALELALHKIQFRIVDNLPVRSDKSRALVIQPRTLELLNRHDDLADTILSRAVIGLGGKFYTHGRVFADIKFADAGFTDTAFRSTVWLSQANTEVALEEELTASGYRVERPFAAESISQDESGVTVTLRDGEENTSVIKCKYVVGCDGAHSVVRHAANLTFDGEPYTQQFILCDVKLDGAYEPGRISFFVGRRVMILFPLTDGFVRLVGVRQMTNSDKEVELDEFRELIKEVAPGNWELHDPIWLAGFRFHHRGVNSYRSGRLFVAGDAAHIHSPAGGQGMNTGIQDAINLGWKLALVLQGKREPTLLDSYDAERRPIGDHLLNGTDKLFYFITSSHPAMQIFRNYIIPILLPLVVRFRFVRARLFRFITEFGIRYRRSPEVTTGMGYRGLVKGGDRAPDGKVANSDGDVCFLQHLCSPREHTLLLFSGLGNDMGAEEALDTIQAKATASAASKLPVLQVYGPGLYKQQGWVDIDGLLHKRYGLENGGGLLLIRPDLYVAFAGKLSSLDELFVAQRTWL